MDRGVRIRMREKGPVRYYQARDLELRIGDYCILESERGNDYGRVVAEPAPLGDMKIEPPVHQVIRVVTLEDRQKIDSNQKDAVEASVVCHQKIREKSLPMKLVEVEYSFDHSRLLFYFTAEGRVDFRELVKELALVFKTRIELRQIGVRDEARIRGGIGPCGRTFCCTSFLNDFEPINIRMAKTQRLSLDPDKISGVCGRLLCCLKYEDRYYRALSRKLPKEGTAVTTPQGEGKVVDLNYIKREVMVEMEDERKLVFNYKDIKPMKQ